MLKRISDFTAATTPLAGTEMLEVETAGGDARKVTAQDIADLAASIPDGDKGDITVSGSGTVWNIDAGAVGTAELADAAVTATKLDAATVAEFVRDTIGAALVAGTGIAVTVNDAGDTITIAATGGGGAGGAGAGAIQLKRTDAIHILGVEGDTGALATNLLPASDTVCFYPFVVARSMTVTQLGTRPNSTVAGKLRCGIYANTDASGQDRPGAVIVQTGDLSITAADQFGSVTSTTLNPGTIYWAAVAQTSNSAGLIALPATHYTPRWFGYTALNSAAITHLRGTLTSGWASLPADAASVTLTYTTGNHYACAAKE